MGQDASNLARICAVINKENVAYIAHQPSR